MVDGGLNMGPYKIVYYGQGYDHAEPITNLAEVKSKAIAWLNKHKIGSVEIVIDRGEGHRDRVLHTYFKDCYTGKVINTHDQKGYGYLVGVNTTWPFFWSADLTNARIKACKFMKKNNLSSISIYTPQNEGFKDVGWILTNGYRYEWSNGSKMYTLNPNTGRISKY